MPHRRLSSLVLGGVVLLAVTPTTAAALAAPATSLLAAPAISLDGGRHIGPQQVAITADTRAEIRYTLDGTAPTRTSTLYTGPVTIDTSATLTAAAFTAWGQSEPALEGYFIKSEEEPLSTFAVMSDIHVSSDSADIVTKWQNYFDALSVIAPELDAIVSNGDQINDNYYNSASDHQYVRSLLADNMARTGMSDTDVLLTFGNHDDRVEKMAAEYPAEWFPHTGNGYYESTIGGFPAFIVNTESWDTAQAEWLYGRLTELSADSKTAGSPIFVFGHRPLPGTVWDGAQSSNAGLKSNLADFPQVIFFSGHSHLNITDERSIHQDTFTSVNEGSMSYEETDSAFQSFGYGLAKEHTIASAQSVIVDVYADRVEIDRVTYAGEDERTYSADGKWSFQTDPPFTSTGTVAGPTWTIDRGRDGEEIKQGFTYTAAERNTVAPVWGGTSDPIVRKTTEGLTLRLPQAQDDQYVKSYSVTMTNTETGVTSEFLSDGDRVHAQYTQIPRPAELEIPLALRAGNKVGAAVDRQLVDGATYEAAVVAYDSYGNASEPRTFAFVAGELDGAALDAATASATTVIERIERVIGDADPLGVDDFAFVVADPDGARALIAQTRAHFTSATPARASRAATATTQDDIDTATAEITRLTEELSTTLVAVDRGALATALADTEAALAGANDDTSELAEALRSAFATANTAAGQTNLAQADIDQVASALHAALKAFASAGQGEQPSVTPSATPDGDRTQGDGSQTNDALAVTGSSVPAIALAVGLGGLAAGAALLLRRRYRQN